MSDLAKDAGIVVPADFRLLGEFAGVVCALAAELLVPKRGVLAWHVEIERHEVVLAVTYVATVGVSEGRASWTLLGILNDGARAAARVIYAICEALDQAGAKLPELEG